mmetsp:Transcript_28750/g.58773  ORF Transcript_28750/g.58773 Transcript_28750/m.58773 type:complete len:397 (-) Transcript_28750:81-1271(-)
MNMILSKIYATTLFIAFNVCTRTTSALYQAEMGGVVAYLPEYRWYVDVEAAVSCCLSDLILFSASVEAGGRLGSHWIPDSNVKRARVAADSVPGRTVNVLLCVGGAGRSAGFPAATRTKAKRRKLVQELVVLLERHELDGVDFDWEAPSTVKEMNDYKLLLRTAHRAFHHRGWLVTIALHPGQSLAAAPSATPYSRGFVGSGDDAGGGGGINGYDFVDRVHLMTYDMSSQLTDEGHHAGFDDAVLAAKHQLSAGLPPHKLSLGIPAYARQLDNPGAVKSYAEALDGPEYGGDLRSGDVTADGFGLNGPVTVKRKVEWALREGLAGVMVWEMGQDKIGHPDSLLSAAASASNLGQVEEELTCLAGAVAGSSKKKRKKMPKDGEHEENGPEAGTLTEL